MPLDATLKIKVSAEDKRRIKKNAAKAGLSMAEFVRRMTTDGRLKVPPARDAAGQPSARTSAGDKPGHRAESKADRPVPVPAEPGASNAEAKPEAAPIDTTEIPEPGETDTAIDPSLETHQAFLTRRTRELYGQGNVTRVARRLAEAEWRREHG